MEDDGDLLDYEDEQAETQEQVKNDATANGDATKKIKVFKLGSESRIKLPIIDFFAVTKDLERINLGELC